MERDKEKKKKDNNTYTVYRDDLDLVTLEKINRGKTKKGRVGENGVGEH